MARLMRDSGVEWIGQIPADKETIRLKFIADISTGNMDTQNKNDSGIYPFYVRSPIVEHSDDYSFDDVEAILMAGDGVGAGRVFHLVSGKYGCHQRVYRLSNFNGISAKFLKYYLEVIFPMIMDYGSAKSTVDSVRLPMIQGVDVVIFDNDEQQRIVCFLEDKVGEIDTIISKTKASIEEYKKYRNSVISEKIISGMDLSVPMKKTGVDWCPQIPKHWNVINPKALFALRKEKAKEGDRQLTASQKKGIMYQDEYMESEGVRVVVVQKDFDILKHVEPDDFVISMRSFQGGLEYSELRGCISSAYVMLIPNKDKVYSPFYKWFFKSSKYVNALQSTSNLVRDGQAMRYSNFAQVPLLDIPLDEQKEIADYLAEKCGEIDALVAKKEAFVEEMEAYKKSLIYESVTGKKEV